jgi:DNA polymerase I-like protein with 3'-5' exonuclease and polymerase domains
MQLPLFQPQSDWVMPESYPNLEGAREVAIDVETCDPHLTSKGSGWPRRDGYVAGIAVAVDGGQWYFPIKHANGGNLSPELTIRWLKNVCSVERDYIFHNAQYDVGWLWAEGVQIKGRIIDTMIVAALLDENRFSYSLNNCLKDYVQERKDEALLREAATEFGIDAKSEMWKLPSIFVGPYAEQDAGGTLRLWQRFKQLLLQEDIQDIFDLETKVLRVAIEMRKRGVRVNLEAAADTKRKLEAREKEILLGIKKEYGVDVEIWTPTSVATAFDSAGLTYERTEKSNAPSFGKHFLKNHGHPLPKLIVEAREINKAHTTFIDTLTKHQHNGRIHAEFHTMRSDEGGTITGRLSCSDPNLQQIPARNPLIGGMIRSLFLPEEGETWGAFDYSSQEPRLVVHYATLMNCEGAIDFAERYHQDPKTDFHQMAADIMGVPRKQAKDLNLGIFYGMGVHKLAGALGITVEEAREIINLHTDKVPFVRKLSDQTMHRAAERGVIRTLLGRRCRFDMWEPRAYGVHKPQKHAEAFAEHGANIKRAFVYKALNKLIQGSAADQTKQAMVTLYYDHGILPMLQVHDELDVSCHSREQALLVQRVMETCVELKIPSLVDAEFGPTWGDAKGTIDDVFPQQN